MCLWVWTKRRPKINDSIVLIHFLAFRCQQKSISTIRRKVSSFSFSRYSDSMRNLVWCWDNAEKFSTGNIIDSTRWRKRVAVNGGKQISGENIWTFSELSDFTIDTSRFQFSLLGPWTEQFSCCLFFYKALEILNCVILYHFLNNLAMNLAEPFHQSCFSNWTNTPNRKFRNFWTFSGCQKTLTFLFLYLSVRKFNWRSFINNQYSSYNKYCCTCTLYFYIKEIRTFFKTCPEWLLYPQILTNPWTFLFYRNIFNVFFRFLKQYWTMNLDMLSGLVVVCVVCSLAVADSRLEQQLFENSQSRKYILGNYLI